MAEKILEGDEELPSDWPVAGTTGYDAAWRLGAGRARKEDPVSAAAGVVWTAGVGERVTAGQPLLELQTDDAARIPRALEAAGYIADWYLTLVLTGALWLG